MAYGLWIEDRSRYTGWFGLAVDGKLTPWVFGANDAAEKAAANYLYNRPDATVTIKPEPPEELPWNETEWRKATQ